MKTLLLTTTLAFAMPSLAAPILIQSTTSTQNSGLYDTILPVFEADTGVKAHVIAVGTGQAIKNAQKCDGDVLFVHAKAAEEAFVDAGYGTARYDVMYNDFVLIGPTKDPAGLSKSPDIKTAFTSIFQGIAPFTSRGDDSGTHKKERNLWALAAKDPSPHSGTWYIETGAGMGATLNTAAAMGAYVMSDRATWVAFQNKADLKIQFEGDPALFNQYGVIAVSPEACPNVNSEGAEAFVTWITSPKGQEVIASHQVAGEQLFIPNAQ
ncbi:MAG: substrate-binding domain-containing protein [Halocynthiibacter sp.]